MQPFLLLFLLSQVTVATAVAGCHSDRDKDHRPRKNCTAAGFSDVPAGLEPTTKNCLSEIYEICLTLNKVPELTPSGAPVLPSLGVLRLGSNRLTSLPDGSFSACPALTELHLSNNAIAALSDQTFSGLSKLEILDLSSNHIRVLPRLMLHPLPAIETLYIEYNKIMVMPDDWFSQKEEVPYLFLSANPWACSCSLGYLHSYLDNYEHNVYVRDGPIYQPDAESVVCDSPGSLKGKPVVELKESDLCSSATEAGPAGDALMFTDAPPTTSTPSTTTAPTTTTTPTTSTTPTTPSPITTIPTTPSPTTSTPTTPSPTTSTPTTPSPITTIPTTSTPSTTTPTTPSPTTSTPTTTIPTTSTPTTTIPTTSTPSTTTAPTTMAPPDPAPQSYSEPPTVVTWSWYHSFTRLVEWSHYSGSEVKGEGSWLGSSAWATTDPATPTATPTVATTTAAAVTPAPVPSPATYEPGGGRRRGKSTGAGLFCFWLFAGCVLLCVASGASALATLARLIIWYRRPAGMGGEGGRDENGVYRKTLYRLFSRQEEIEGWRDVMEECRVSAEERGGRGGEGGADGGGGARGGGRGGGGRGGVSRKRYSVILREEREEAEGGREELDWVVGGWEVAGGGGRRRGEEEAEQRSSWGEWLAHYLPSMPWGVAAPPEAGTE
uniref:uncharacterized protein n=1 Tax=Centroberyx gerrardi TaxID=166262 RepID=UPI003AACC44E